MMQSSGGDFQTPSSSSSGDGQSPSHHTPVEPDAPGNSFHPSTVPVTQPLNSVTHSPAHTLEEKQGGVTVLNESRENNSTNGMNQEFNNSDVSRIENSIEGHSRVDAKIMTLEEAHKYASSVGNQEENEENEVNLDNEDKKEDVEEMKTKMQTQTSHKEIKKNSTSGSENEQLSPSNIDYVAMRVEFIDQSKSTSPLNGAVDMYASGMDGINTKGMSTEKLEKTMVPDGRKLKNGNIKTGGRKTEAVIDDGNFETLIPEATKWKNGLMDVQGKSGRKTKTIDDNERNRVVPVALNDMIINIGNNERKTKAVMEDERTESRLLETFDDDGIRRKYEEIDPKYMSEIKTKDSSKNKTKDRKAKGVIEYGKLKRLFQSRGIPLKTMEMNNTQNQDNFDLNDKVTDGVPVVTVSRSRAHEYSTSHLDSQSPVPSQSVGGVQSSLGQSQISSQFESSQAPFETSQSPIPSQYESSQSNSSSSSKHSQIRKQDHILKKSLMEEEDLPEKKSEMRRDIKETRAGKPGLLSLSKEDQIAKSKPQEDQRDNLNLTYPQNQSLPLSLVIQSPEIIQSHIENQFPSKSPVNQSSILNERKKIHSQTKSFFTHLPSVHFPSSPDPYIHSPTKSPHKSPPQSITSPQKLKSPEDLHSPTKYNVTESSHLSPTAISPHKRNSRSAKETQVSQASETDDEKMRNLNEWLQGRSNNRSATPSSSSVSISEHLQQSHASWTKPRRDKGEEDVPQGNEIELSDLEDLSLSGITLTNSSLRSPRDGDF